MGFQKSISYKNPRHGSPGPIGTSKSIDPSQFSQFENFDVFDDDSSIDSTDFEPWPPAAPASPPMLTVTTIEPWCNAIGPYKP